ncbi:MAG: hypothetical protein GOV00_00890 [Candidatus Altiarchaeota archaeon]|nr:hypothetical protein [Candidatus Altiarchaeota archaeon]
MAYSVSRTVYGSAVRNSKQSLVAAMARYIEIVKTSAENSLGVKFDGNLDVTVIRPSGISVTSKEKTLTEVIFKELVGAMEFKVEFLVRGKSRALAGITHGGCKITFWYDEEKNRGNSMNIEFATEYIDKHLNFRFLALLGTPHIIKKSSFRKASESFNARMIELWENVLKNYTGDSMTKSIEKHDLARYEIDALILNIFGKFVKVRKQ